MEERPKAPGLKYRPRKNSPDQPYWIAPKEAAAAGFKPRIVRLQYPGWQDDPRKAAAMLAYCGRLNVEAAAYLGGISPSAAAFDGSFGSLLERYLTDPESSYKRLKPSSVHPYSIYAQRLKERISDVRIDRTDGRDVQRWFRQWAGVDNLKHPDAKLPRAHTMLAVLKAAVSFGVMCRLDGCAEFSGVLRELQFPAKQKRQFAPTAAQIDAVRAAAHAAGAPSRALAYVLQFETSLRQWDVIGIWVPLSDPRPSSILDGNEKWIGPTWAMVDDDLVLRITYGKTEDTSALHGAYDLKVCPMVMQELEHWPSKRRGPLIVNERTGLPYKYDRYWNGWKRDFEAAGLPCGMWNRDLRAGAITEGGMAGASSDDRRKVAGHTTDRQVAQVYDRDTLEAHRRVMAARTAGRTKQGE